MNLSKRVVMQLERLAAQGPKEIEAVSLQSGGYLVGVVAEGQEPAVVINLEAYDRFSAAVHYLEVADDNLSPGPQPDYLHQCARRAEQRLTYLEEPLVLLELDRESNLAQLRSHPPHQHEQTLTYWELLVWAEPHARARLTRYRWSPDKPERESVVYPATFATVGRIAQDLALSLIEP
jgi:hypothetical protein